MLRCLVEGGTKCPRNTAVGASGVGGGAGARGVSRVKAGASGRWGLFRRPGGENQQQTQGTA